MPGVLHILVGRDKKFRKPKPDPDELLSCDARASSAAACPHFVA
jgi:hypothetical protein